MSYDFNSESQNSNTSSKNLKRMEFEFNGSTFKFLLNPETYEQTEPSRANITHTKLGAYIETFGSGIIELNISGVTGLRNNTDNIESGYQKFKALRDLIKSVYDNVKDGSEITKFLNFYNFTDNEYYVTYPDKFVLSRSKSQPLLYRYSIHLYCLRRIGESAQRVSTTSVNNPLKVENTVSSTLGSAGVSSSNTSSASDLIAGIDTSKSTYYVKNYASRTGYTELKELILAGKVTLENGVYVYNSQQGGGSR